MAKKKGKKKSKADKERAAERAAAAAAPTEEAAAKAALFKTEGNGFFAAKNYAEAVSSFNRAIALDSTQHVYFSNRSAAYLGLGKAKKATNDARKCIELNPTWGKGFSRLGAALYASGKFAEAVGAYAQGLAVEPSNATLTAGLAQAQAALTASASAVASGAGAGGAGAGAGGGSDEITEATSAVERLKIERAARREAEAEAGAGGGKAEEEKREIEDVIGIDLGTTYSCVGVWRNDRVQLVPMDDGNMTMASCVAFTDEERIIGNAAKQQASSNPENTVYDAKRLIGGRFGDTVIQRDIKSFPFAVVPDADDKPLIEIELRGEKHRFAPEQISAMVLRKLKETAEAFMDKELKAAVITVPAYFSDAQRAATKHAGAIAGLDVKRIINEPTAAALAYGLDTKTRAESKDRTKTNVLIFDLGGGTFDVSLLSIEEGIFEVRATNGDTHLGGEDFDSALVNFVATQFKRKTGMDLTSSKRAVRRLRTACERAKRALSSSTTANLELESLFEGEDLATVITRAKFEDLNMRLFTRCMDTVKRVLKDAACGVGEVDDIVLVGGSTRIPKIQEMLRTHFKGKELCKNINPDEAVAYGATVQGAILSGVRSSTTQDLLLVDVTPLSLGIETTGRIMSTLIKRNTPVPVRRTKQYTTEEDYQDAVDVCVYEGERGSTEGNNLLGQFTISGIERAKRNVPKIDVTFDLDSNGMLHVTAVDQTTGAEADIKITNSGRLSSEDVERMIHEAQIMRAADEARMAAVEARSELESYVFAALEEVEATGDRKLERLAKETKEWIDVTPKATKAQCAEKLLALQASMRT